jgi:hypothetical protein
MTRQAYIALERFAYDSEFSITQVDHNPLPTFLPPTHHKLADGYTVDDIINIFHDTVGFDARLGANGFVVSLPLNASFAQTDAFSKARDHRVCDHFAAWVAAYATRTSDSEDVHLLFIDLTPGQMTSTVVANGRIQDRRSVSGHNTA